MEIEVKILEIDKKQIEKKLVALGARKIFDGTMHVLSFDFPDLRLRKKKDFLRLRTEGQKTMLTYKKKVSKKRSKKAIEYEAKVSDFQKTKVLLEALGLKITFKIDKKRTEYELPNVKFAIDTYPGIPTFMEIEADSEKKVFSYAKRLGFPEKDCRAWTGRDVFEYYGKTIKK